jgi:hypothetical protein
LFLDDLLFAGGSWGRIGVVLTRLLLVGLVLVLIPRLIWRRWRWDDCLLACSCRDRGGTRSTGVDEEALIASGILDGAKNLDELDRDQVMVKLGETIQPMKDSFIVAFLNWSGAKKEDLEVPEAVAKYREEHPEEAVPLKSGNNRYFSGKTREETGPVDKTDGLSKSLMTTLKSCSVSLLTIAKLF